MIAVPILLGLALPLLAQGPDLEKLRSLPYVSWSAAGADPSKTGVTVHDRSRTSPGYNLFTDDQSRAFLMDNRGRVVHQWKFPARRQCEFARVLPDGSALGECVNEGVFKVDRNSAEVFSYRSFVHHDVEPLADGGFVVPDWAGSFDYRGRKVRFERLTFLNREGVAVDHWSLWDHFDELRRLHLPSPLDTPAASNTRKEAWEYYHLNSVQEIPSTPLGADPRFRPGNLLVSFRNVSLIAILDRATKTILWSWGPGVLDYQHMPTMLPNGNILVFDNGTNRGYSRVVELNPRNRTLVWTYPPKGQPGFFSKWRGSAQRLANGNTLICDSDNGRVFEVTREGVTVWEFWSPFINAQGKRRGIYRLPRAEIPTVPFAVGPPVPVERLKPPR